MTRLDNLHEQVERLRTMMNGSTDDKTFVKKTASPAKIKRLRN